jgi:shikimate kinase
MKDNITLIGMPGCGKSTIGVLLAKALNYSFLDSDLVIQREQNMKLQEIIDTYGNDRFKEIENEVNSSLTVSRTIIATGGSVVYGREAMEHLSQISYVVYINLTCEEIVRRVNNIHTRGISMKKGETLYDLYRERQPLYEKYADYSVDCNGLNVEETVEKIMHVLNVNA